MSLKKFKTLKEDVQNELVYATFAKRMGIIEADQLAKDIESLED